MKKIFIFFAILFSIIMAKEFTSRDGIVITSCGVNVREEPNENAQIVYKIKQGVSLPYTDVLGYAYVDIVDGATKKLTSDYVGKAGWISEIGIK